MCSLCSPQAPEATKPHCTCPSPGFFDQRGGGSVASGPIWWVLGRSASTSCAEELLWRLTSPSSPCTVAAALLFHSPLAHHPYRSTCQWGCCCSTPWAPPSTCLYFPVIMNITQRIRSRANLTPFGIKNMSPLDVSTGLCRTQHKNADLKGFVLFCFKQAIYILLTYAN